MISSALADVCTMWVRMSTCFGKAAPGKNGKSCVTVGPVIRTASIPAYSWLKALAVNTGGHPADVRRILAVVKVPLDARERSSCTSIY